jgi:hypothetical protein
VKGEAITGNGYASAARTFCLILFPQGVEDSVVDILDQVGVPGYTQAERVIGRGQRGRHFDNPIWPGADGAIFTVTSPDQVSQISTVLVDLSKGLDEKSHGLYGVHVFTWPCEQVS